MKQLHSIQICEDSPRFVWEILTQLHNFRKWDFSKNVRVIVFLPHDKLVVGFNPIWKDIQKMFPEAKFFFYADNSGKATDLIVNYDYKPILRLCCLEQHFKDHPELEKDAIFYSDTDVIFTQYPDFEDYIEDDINYLSDAHTYMNSDYFSSKANIEADGTPQFLQPDKVEAYSKIDPLEKCLSFAKLTKDVAIKNKNSTGGAQYLFKNMNSKFFSECINICLLIRMYLQAVNQEFFKGDTKLDRENNGFQSWAADMWAIQFNLWAHNLPSETPKFMDFGWVTDKIEDRKECFLLHNAGIVSDGKLRVTQNLKSVKGEDGKPTIIDCPAFWKGAYTRMMPFADIPKIEEVVNHPISSQYLISTYCQEIIDTYNSLLKIKENAVSPV